MSAVGVVSSRLHCMKFGVLGPLSVQQDDTPLHPGPSQRRALLAVLLCHVNRSVPVEQMVSAVWGEDPPRTAAKNVQVHVYHLRRLFADPDRIVHAFTGYTLHAGLEEIDAVRFERLLAMGKEALARNALEQAEQKLTAALALWRGSAFADLDKTGIAVREALRLNELRIVAQEVRNEARLRAGRHQMLIPELFALLAQYPFRERLAGQLMTALYRDGRQTEALEAYQRVRRALAEELGMDPGARLMALHTSILRGADPDGTTIDAETVEAHALPPPAPQPRGSRGEPARETLDWFVAAADAADRALSVARLERLAVADPQVVPAPELYRPAGARRWLDREQDNLHAALLDAFDRGWANHAWRLAHGMYSLFRLGGGWGPWLAAYEAAVEAATMAGAGGAVGPLRVGLAAAHAGAGAPDEAAHQLVLALSAARLSGNRRCQVAAHCELTRLALADGQLDEAERQLCQAERVAGDEPTAGAETSVWLQRLRGQLEFGRGRHDRATCELEQALATAVALGDGTAAAMALCALSEARLSRGDRAGGAAFARQAVAVASTCRDLPAEQFGHRQLHRCQSPAGPGAG